MYRDTEIFMKILEYILENVHIFVNMYSVGHKYPPHCVEGL